MTKAGFPHSDISGSTLQCSSPERFAAVASFVGSLSLGIRRIPSKAYFSQLMSARCMILYRRSWIRDASCEMGKTPTRHIAAIDTTRVERFSTQFALRALCNFQRARTRATGARSSGESEWYPKRGVLSRSRRIVFGSFWILLKSGDGRSQRSPVFQPGPYGRDWKSPFLIGESGAPFGSASVSNGNALYEVPFLQLSFAQNKTTHSVTWSIAERRFDSCARLCVNS